MTQPTPNLSRDLMRIHKVITRGLEVGLSTGKEYINLGNIATPDLIGYSRYVHCLATVLGAHHTSEDQITFPEFRKVLPLAPYAQLSIDHHEVELLLEKLPPAISDLSGDASQAGLKVIIETLEKISAIWYRHIGLEEYNFSEDAINAVFNLDEQKRIGDAAGKHSQERTAPPFWVVPFILFNLENEERAIMAASIPPAVVDELVPKVWKEQWAPMKPFLLE